MPYKFYPSAIHSGLRRPLEDNQNGSKYWLVSMQCQCIDVEQIKLLCIHLTRMIANTLLFTSSAGSYCLILWLDERSVTVVPESVVLGYVALGKECQVKLGHKKYTGQILAVGTCV